MPHKFQRGWPLLLFLLIIPGITFLLLYGLPMTHDGATHLLRIARLDTYLRAGFLFPRWLPDLILGHGYPALNYYAASTYYLIEALHLLGIKLYYAFIVAQILLVYLAAVGIYLFARDLFSDLFSGTSKDRATIPALVTSVAYVYAPYLLINIYVRGAIAELGAQMVLPWIFWSFRRIWRSPDPQRYVLLAIFTLGGLAWTHTISLLIIPPLLLLYLLLLLSQTADYLPRIGWSAVAGVGAIGISAFYWLPLIVERQSISDVGVAISKTLMLPISFIDWGNWIDTGFRYTFPEDPPYRFGLLQVTGTVLGLCFLWRKGRELWFWVGIGGLCLLMMSDITRPLWFSNDILPIIQLPWRLQAVMQFPVALLFGVPLTMMCRPWLRGATALVIIALLIHVHLPHLPWAYLLSDESSFGMAQNAYFEAERTYVVESSQMTTTVQEFRPKWAAQTLTLDPDSVAPSSVSVTAAQRTDDLHPQSNSNATTIQVTAANPFRFQLTVDGEQSVPLRFATFFFPGWTATLDGQTKLIPYPSTNLGLLTVDVPAGDHTLRVAWTGTAIAVWGGLISQLTLLAIGLWQLSPWKFGPGDRWGRRGRERWWGLVPLLCLGVGLVATYGEPPRQPVQPYSGPALPGLALLGYQPPTVTEEGIHAQVYWLVTENTPPPLALRWQLRNAAQQVVAETVSAPFYDAYSTEQWARHTVVDDAYLIPVPTAAPAGRYTLQLIPFAPASDASTPLLEEPLTVGTIILPGERPMREPMNSVAAQFENQIVLHGYDIDVVERLFRTNQFLPAHPEILVAPVGDTLDYRLYWQAQQETNEPYISFLHLTNYLGQPIAQYDHLPGPLFRPPAIWATYNRYRDKFLVEIPPHAASGLYWPNVGMYNWQDESRIPARTVEGEELGDHVKLAPVKVLNAAIRTQGTVSNARLGTLATLVSFDVAGDTDEEQHNGVPVAPGAELTLTLYYRAQEPSTEPLRRFVQIRNGAEQILAQIDGEPQNGINPTWSWLPGEVVRDQVTVQIPAEAAAGSYQLYLGFYQPAEPYERLPAFDRQGTVLANREVALRQVTVLPAGKLR